MGPSACNYIDKLASIPNVIDKTPTCPKQSEANGAMPLASVQHPNMLATMPFAEHVQAALLEEGKQSPRHTTIENAS